MILSHQDQTGNGMITYIFGDMLSFVLAVYYYSAGSQLNLKDVRKMERDAHLQSIDNVMKKINIYLEQIKKDVEHSDLTEEEYRRLTTLLMGVNMVLYSEVFTHFTD